MSRFISRKVQIIRGASDHQSGVATTICIILADI